MNLTSSIDDSFIKSRSGSGVSVMGAYIRGVHRLTVCIRRAWRHGGVAAAAVMNHAEPGPRGGVHLAGPRGTHGIIH